MPCFDTCIYMVYSLNHGKHFSNTSHFFHGKVVKILRSSPQRLFIAYLGILHHIPLLYTHPLSDPIPCNLLPELRKNKEKSSFCGVHIVMEHAQTRSNQLLKGK